jgi:hypothetical protein
MAIGGGAPADDVDHEVFVRLNRFKVSENLVIDMIWAWTLRTGWSFRHCVCHGLVGSLGGVSLSAVLERHRRRAGSSSLHVTIYDLKRRPVRRSAPARQKRRDLTASSRVLH